MYQLVGVAVLIATATNKKALRELPITISALFITFWPAVFAMTVQGWYYEAKEKLPQVYARAKKWLLAGLALPLFFMAAPLHAQAPAQNPPLLIFADTAGVARVVENVYVTWIFAKASPTSLPSSGVLVAFDCEKHLVKRLAHVVYHLSADSSGVEGAIVEDNGPWVEPVIPRLFDLVCEIGATREPQPEPEQPTPKPESMYPIS